MKSATIYIFGLVLFCLCPACINAQVVNLEKGTKVNDLWCFPLEFDSTTWVYFPHKASLSYQNNKPEFSLLRYVKLVPDTKKSSQTITQAEGGSILHFLVKYETPESEVRKAEEILRETLQDDSIHIRGPYIFNSGKYAMISSVLKMGGVRSNEILMTGEAPVLEGSKLAFSFELNPDQTSLLLASLSQKTSDISLVFDLGFTGIASAFDADLVVNWEDVYKYYNVQGGVSIYVVNADVKYQVEDWEKNNVIYLDTKGKSERSEALIEKVYDKILTLLFRPINLQADNKTENPELVNSAMASAGKSNFPFGLNFGYEMRNLDHKGSINLEFNTRETVERHHFITMNLGDVMTRYRTDSTIFRTIQIGNDPDYWKRTILVGIDGSLDREFGNMFNNVGIKFKKIHEHGQPDIQEVSISPHTYRQQDDLVFTYGGVGDTDREKWLNYNYQVTYNFQGGHSYTDEWKTVDANMITVFCPYLRETVNIKGNLTALRNQHVRAVITRIEYDFFGEKRKSREFIAFTKEDEYDEQYEITVPLGNMEYMYTVTFVLNDGKQKTVKGQSTNGLLLLDNLNFTD